MKITYNSDSVDPQIIFWYKNIKIYSSKFILASDIYNVLLNIQSLRFKKGERRKKFSINPLFLNPDDDELTPISFVNNNLFNNYTLFNTSIMKTKKDSHVLAQMLGFINVVMEGRGLSFNSDRTQFTESSVSDSIKSDIRKLNESIQIQGSKIRNELISQAIPLTTKSTITRKDADDEKSRNSIINKNLLLASSVHSIVLENVVKYSLFDRAVDVQIIDEGIKPKTSEVPKTQTTNLCYRAKRDNISQIMEKITINDSSKFLLDGEIMDKLDLNQNGLWKVFSKENGKNLEFDIDSVAPVSPSVGQRITNVNIHERYPIDRLFRIRNSFNIDDHMRFDVTEYDSATGIDMKKGEIVFDTTGVHKLKILVKYKDTDLINTSEWSFTVTEKGNSIPNADFERELVYLLISEGNDFPREVCAYYQQLNELFKQGGFDFPLVASFRTLVEVVVEDILDNAKISKDDNLNTNYSKALGLVPEFLSKIENKKSSQIIKNVYAVACSSKSKEAYIKILNLGTHSGQRFVNREIIQANTNELALLLELLNFQKSNVK